MVDGGQELAEVRTPVRQVPGEMPDSQNTPQDGGCLQTNRSAMDPESLSQSGGGRNGMGAS